MSFTNEVFLKYIAPLHGYVLCTETTKKNLHKCGSLDDSSLSYGLIYFGRRRIKDKVQTHPQESVYIQTDDSNNTDYCFDKTNHKKWRSVAFVLLHSA
jgi:hypothetical protein